MVVLCLVDSPQHNGSEKDDIDDESGVEGKAQLVDEQQFEPSSDGNDARNYSVENSGNDDKRDEQGNE